MKTSLATLTRHLNPAHGQDKYMVGPREAGAVWRVSGLLVPGASYPRGGAPPGQSVTTLPTQMLFR